MIKVKRESKEETLNRNINEEIDLQVSNKLEIPSLSIRVHENVDSPDVVDRNQQSGFTFL